MYERILVPLDGSDLALQALPYARTVFGATGAEVELLSVIEPIESLAKGRLRDSVAVGAGGRPRRASTDNVVRLLNLRRNEAMKTLEATAESLGGTGRVRCIVREGDPAQAIIEEADERPNTLIAMATHGRSGIGRWLLGSVTDKVARHAKHPTLVVRAREDTRSAPPLLRKVLLPLDGSSTAEAAIPHGVEIAKTLGLGITLLHATSRLSPAEVYTEYIVYDDWFTQVQTDARSYLGGIAQRIRGQGVEDVNEHVMVGNAGSLILDAADDALVVMATHGRSGVGRWLLGSVTDRVVRHSSGPVLVVRPGDPAQPALPDRESAEGPSEADSGQVEHKDLSG